MSDTLRISRILYVEDDDDIRTVATMALEAIGGFSVIACASGQEAIAAAPGCAPDLLLLDVMMPGLDGPETLKALRCLPETRNTPAIFMTAKVQLGELARHAADGALGVVAKPFDPVELPSEIRRICGVLVPVNGRLT